MYKTSLLSSADVILTVDDRDSESLESNCVPFIWKVVDITGLFGAEMSFIYVKSAGIKK